MTTFPVAVELELDGVWTDVTNRHYHTGGETGPITITRGRADESSEVAPTTATLTFDNTDGALSPRNPTSPWYPHIRRGLPCRISVQAGAPYLLLSGAAGGRASTPDNAAIDTGDLFVAVELWPPIHLPAPGTRHELVAKYNSATNQRAYHYGLDEFGRPVLFWSTDGTAGTVQSSLADWSLPNRTAGPVTIAVHLDVNVAGSDHVTYHWGIEGALADLLAALAADETAVRLGDPDLQVATTSIFNSSAPLEIGDITGSSDVTYQGGVRRVQVRAGNWTGTIGANPDFTLQAPGATAFTDSAGRVWSLAGDATITDRQPRFVGTASTVPLDWPMPRRRDDLVHPGIARATVEVSGLLRQLQQGAKPVHSTLRRLVSSPSVSNLVHAYWPLEDDRDATLAASGLPNVRPGSILGATLASDDTLDASDALPSVAASTLFRWRFDVPPSIPANTNWQSTMFVRIPTAPTSELQMMVVDTSSIQARTVALQISSTNVRFRALDHTGTEVVNDTLAADPRMFGTWMLVALNITQNGGNIDWDYDLILIPDGFGFGDSGSLAGSCGRPTRLRAGSTTPATGDGFSFGHFIVTTNAATGWLAGADTAWVGETAAHRVWRLCREEQIPVAIVGDNTTAAFFRGNGDLSSPMGPQRLLTLPELLQECADTDLGILYEQRGAPGLAFRTRRSLYNQATALTLDQALDGITPPFEPVLDDQRLRNHVTVKRPDGGSSPPAVDDESIALDGLYDVEVDANVRDDLLLPNQAGWRLHLGAWPELRLPGVGTELEKAGPGVAGEWLDVDLGDRVIADNLPRQYDRTVDEILEGYEESLWFYGWAVTLVGSPAGPWEVGVRNDAVRGRRDTAGSELAAGIDGDDTSLSVSTTLGPVWSTAGGDVPFDVHVGGERMTVTAISGATSPQTFTVTRSVNGVVKAHLTGAAVSLWRPTIRAL